MTYQIYSVFDCKVGAYLPPVFVRSTGEFLRSFEQAANESSHHFCKYAEDYTAFHIGEWDDEKCVFVLKPTPVSLGKAIEFIKSVAPDLKTASMSDIREAFSVKEKC